MSLNELDNLSDAPDLHQIGSMPNPRKRKATFDVDDLPLQPAHPSPTPSSPTATPKRQRLALKAPVTAPTHIAPNNVPAALPPALPPTPQTRTRKTGRKDRLATDPINVSVYDLRKQALPWDDIATRTNAACQLEDELTPAACYSRFFRNGPLVAKGKGEEFKKEWYVHMKAAVNATQQPSGADGQEKEEEGKEKEQGAEVDEEKETSKMKQALVVSAVEAVKGNFWASVAAKVNGGLGDKENMGQEEVKALWEGMEGDEE